ncbi:hypothetical protein [Anaerosacchariphilus polymeriproducens]|uniref:hypothetical protein n=1 Tax=Anaerosacchariphilus polymeriproducens TaxID=1812858 RepID=UPI0019616025|nr:hypothetical protein [Anaerosacchariphilus polymeriproducens]
MTVKGMMIIRVKDNIGLNHKTTSGCELSTTMDKTTTILGNYNLDTGPIISELKYPKTSDFGARAGYFNLLNTPDNSFETPRQFWEEYNRPWLDLVIQRKDIIKLATFPENKYLIRINDYGKYELSGFGKEYTYLRKNNYYYDISTNSMIPKGDDMNDKSLINNIFKELASEYSFDILLENNNVYLKKDDFNIELLVSMEDIDIIYVEKRDNCIYRYFMTQFIKRKFDMEDRNLFGKPCNNQEKLIARMKVIEHGLKTKWKRLLEGDKRWKELYEKDAFGGEPIITNLENE